MTKFCSPCNSDLDIDEFRIDNKKTGRRHSCCKECQKKYAKKYYKEYYSVHIDEYTKTRKHRRRTTQEKIFELLVDKHCVDCGESNPLTLDFDHVSGKKVFSISKSYHKRWEIVEKELQKCIIRCANCHRIKTAKERNHARVKFFEGKTSWTMEALDT
jgi:hypothetical protein